MTKLEKLYSIIENSREVGVKLSKDVLQQVEELEEGIIKEEILPALGNDIAPRLEPIKPCTLQMLLRMSLICIVFTKGLFFILRSLLMLIPCVRESYA